MVKEISVHELAKWQNQNKDFQLIDVREKDEYDFVNIGAELIPLSDLMLHVDKIRTDCDKVIHCRSGSRSAQAILILQDLGIEDLYNLKGGINAYAQEIDASLTQY